MNQNEPVTAIITSLVDLQQATLAVQGKLEADAICEPELVPSDEELQALYSEAIGAATCLLNLAMSCASVSEQRAQASTPIPKTGE